MAASEDVGLMHSLDVCLRVLEDTIILESLYPNTKHPLVSG